MRAGNDPKAVAEYGGTRAAGGVRVAWRDLVGMSPREKLMEVMLPVPWLAAGLWCFGSGWWVAGVAASFYFFLTGLRLSHGAQHYSLGLPKVVQDLVLFTLSVLMGASMHAVQVSHLQHHQHCLEPEDHEGSVARLSWWEAIRSGPLFYLGLHRAAWERASRLKRWWMAAEVAGIGLGLGIAFCWPSAWSWHLAAMVVGECFTAFFAVWTVHHHCDGTGTLSRTQRGRWANFISYNMFFHAEHHLCPAVPTCHLPVLAARLDAVAPNFAERQVLGLE